MFMPNDGSTTYLRAKVPISAHIFAVPATSRLSAKLNAPPGFRQSDSDGDYM